MHRRLTLGWMLGFSMLLTRIEAESQGRGAGQEELDEVNEPVYDLSTGVSPPRATRTKKPEYTDRARRAGIQGSVVVRFVVTSNGLPKRIVVVERLDTDLDRAAVEALREWRFEPATKQGKPIAVHLSAEFTFRAL
jgi:protein TonB